ncbi:hypothetical protein BV898_15401 [Hypsibius exemplaris]|uniref:Uncharacterized protein n=1 Tax=Hypsibius exemplaris TaxID=2072580 RepID=A0A9X6RK57_HYPEX|nr:hypothetical protein BV898_15401 [Hypsibius exemplaris]
MHLRPDWMPELTGVSTCVLYHLALIETASIKLPVDFDLSLLRRRLANGKFFLYDSFCNLRRSRFLSRIEHLSCHFPLKIAGWLSDVFSRQLIGNKYFYSCFRLFTTWFELLEFDSRGCPLIRLDLHTLLIVSMKELAWKRICNERFSNKHALGFIAAKLSSAAFGENKRC